MFEADALCDRLAVIAEGRFVATGTPVDLKSTVADRTIIELETFGATATVIDRVRALTGVKGVAVENRDQTQVVLVQSAVGGELVQPILRELDAASVGKVVMREPTLEDAYIELVRST